MLRKIAEFYLWLVRAFRRIVDAVFWAIRSGLYWGFLLIAPLLLIWYVIGALAHKHEFRDKDEFRGAAAITNDPIDQDVAKENISYLEQNWDEEDSLWFYSATQGSNLLPYDFFLHLEQLESTDLFRSNEHINRFRYLPQDASVSNPDGLPLGMTKDEYQGREYMGFTCAACHTSQINYVDDSGVAKGLRIDGGPAAANLEVFLIELEGAMVRTRKNPQKLERFAAAVMTGGAYRSAQAVADDLDRYIIRIGAYNLANKPQWQRGNQKGVTHYGFSRLDAFGRIYNRVLQYLVEADQLRAVLDQSLPSDVLNAADADLVALYEHEDQTNLVLRAVEIINPYLEKLPKAERDALWQKMWAQIYNPANAPASYPYMWDIAQSDFVQWTGLVSNGGIGPLGRNVGQVIGVFGTLDWQRKKGWSISSLIGGQGIESNHIDFKSSIDKRNLRRVEEHLRKLWSPVWPQALGAIDMDKAAKGAPIFAERCASCHANINRTDPERRVVASISKIEALGTDPVLALNSVNYKGDSGLIQGEYVEAGAGELVIEPVNPVASLVKFSTKNVVTSFDPDKFPIRRAAEWAWDTLQASEKNEIKATMRRGNYQPGTTVNPFLPIRSYKARALNGIWATAPYLHNGSVPNLYELLLPKKREGDPDVDEQGNPIEYRSDKFLVGSREFDVEKVGFRDSGYSEHGFLFDTSLPGNSNAGHEYAAGRTGGLNGEVFAPLNKAERGYLLEYLKTL